MEHFVCCATSELYMSGGAGQRMRRGQTASKVLNKPSAHPP